MTYLEIYYKTRYELVDLFLKALNEKPEINTDYIDEIFKEEE